MNPVNATALYVSASRAVLQCDPRQPHTFTDMYNLLPFFRQSLACLVCGKLLQDPISPTHPECEHYVCLGCKGQKMQIRPSCNRCKDYSSFQENKQLSLLVQSYRKLCLYVTHSPLLQLIGSHVGGSPEVMALLEEVLVEEQPQAGLDGESTSRELEEGEVLLLSVEEVLQTLDPLQPTRDSSHIQPERTHTHTHITTDRAHAQMYIQLDAAHNYTQIRTERTNTVASHGAHLHLSSFDPPPNSKRPPVRLKRKRSRSESDREKVKPLPIASILQGSSTHIHTPSPSQTLHTQLPTPSLTVPAHTYSSLPNGVPPKPARPAPNHNKSARKHVDPGPKKPHAKARSGGGSKTKDGSKEQRLMSGCLVPPAPVRPPYKKPVEKKGCKCGRATQNPSVLTCRGQRCPCYSNRKACLDCICRGCQNSYMANGEKKLEAFAVPEKALEQTRLTLGINLTSITAAAALRNPATTSIRANTLLNVATATGTPVTTAYLTPSPPQEPNFEDSLELLIG
uniref:E3 ubiquitin-protein ligase MSL2 n=1 Tax=Mola mola TaxID=94237 RepID=A0A3Q3X130_MOLML